MRTQTISFRLCTSSYYMMIYKSNSITSQAITTFKTINALNISIVILIITLKFFINHPSKKTHRSNNIFKSDLLLESSLPFSHLVISLGISCYSGRTIWLIFCIPHFFSIFLASIIISQCFVVIFLRIFISYVSNNLFVLVISALVSAVYAIIGLIVVLYILVMVFFVRFVLLHMVSSCTPVYLIYYLLIFVPLLLYSSTLIYLLHNKYNLEEK